jgi:glycine dehydrogenase subunit 2
VRAWTYIRELGAEGLRDVSGRAVLNANYLRARLEGSYHLPYKTDLLHEVVFSDRDQKKHGVSAMDVAKRLIDHGFHPPTVYFPLVVQGALMMEPTETESKETLDAFVTALEAIAEEARTDAAAVQSAPTQPYHARLDETRAARFPVLRWTPGMDLDKLQGGEAAKAR